MFRFSQYEKSMLIWAAGLIFGFFVSSFVGNPIILILMWSVITIGGILFMLELTYTNKSQQWLEVLWILPLIVGLIVTALQLFNIFSTPYPLHIFWLFLCGVVMALMGIFLKDYEYTVIGFCWILAGIVFIILNLPVFLAGFILGGPITFRPVLKYIEWKLTGQQTLFKVNEPENPVP